MVSQEAKIIFASRQIFNKHQEKEAIGLQMLTTTHFLAHTLRVMALLLTILKSLFCISLAFASGLDDSTVTQSPERFS